MNQRSFFSILADCKPAVNTDATPLKECSLSGRKSQHALLPLLGICQRTIHIIRTPDSLHFKQFRRFPAKPRTLGEHLRKKCIDISLSMAKLAKILGPGVSDMAIEKWENDQNRPTAAHRSRIVEFIGFDPQLSEILNYLKS